MKTIFIASSLWLVTLSVPTTLYAQADGVTEREGLVVRTEGDDDTRLRRWLHIRAERSKRTLEIVSGFAAGAAATGLGVYSLVDDEQSDVLGRLLLGAGLFGFAQPIMLLATRNHPVLDYENLPDRPLSEREIGHFEGILLSEARVGRALRIGSGLYGGFLLAGSSVALGLTLLQGNIRDSALEFGAYAGLAIGGLIRAVAAFFRSPAERLWDNYVAGVVPASETSRFEFRGDSVRVIF